ncbi:MAG TPA: hypothetical protein VKV18_14560 [Chthonomonas sp.]|uniref:hypothetical protein n=1 Tax=Chthonomonas sp. TaxID=2282153 RepID=UPI002B4AFA84|nr:hypothetical protein [Chthonomonas sp.]HLI49892.1 hypothetical protein [Chthonomonas sp.]
MKRITIAIALIFGCLPAFLQASAQTSPPSPSSSSTALELAEPERPNRVVGYTGWDDQYLYIGVVVNKATLHGTNSTPFSDPLKDDAILILIQTDDDHTITKPNTKTVVVAASAVGGLQLYRGPDFKPLFNGMEDINERLKQIQESKLDEKEREAERIALLSQIIKYAVAPHGAQRLTGTFVPGYTLEAAIPWVDLGVKPAPGVRLGFTVATQSTTPDSPKLLCLSPRVTGLSDLYNPSLWGQLVLSEAAAPAHIDTLVCPRFAAAKPVIDGTVSPGEWNAESAFVFGGETSAGLVTLNTQQAREHPPFHPQVPQPVVPITFYPSRQVAPHKPQPVTPALMALYYYNYQADPRKEAPPEGVVHNDGSTALAHHPLDGSGPWFSYDCADWHLQQIVAARQAGIDVILPVYRLTARNQYADKGLSALVVALLAAKASRQDYPLVALYLDLDGARDLTEEAIYSGIRDFYQHIPPEFRFSVPLDAVNGGGIAYPVFITHADAIASPTPSLFTDLRRRFSQEFAGSDLLFIGTPDYHGLSLDGVFELARDKGVTVEQGGWIQLATLSPGYDPTVRDNSAEAVKHYVPRNDGATYREHWNAALSADPNWILVDSWNGYTDATEVAPSLEDGYITVDITREYAQKWIGLHRTSARFFTVGLPRHLEAGSTVDALIRVENTGTEVWGAKQTPIALAYRWVKDGTPVAYGEPIPLPESVAPGQNVSIPLQIHVLSPNGAPLAPGAYTLEIGLTTLQRAAADTPFLDTNLPGGMMKLPEQVENASELPPIAAEVIQSDLRPMMESGSVYTVHALLRNNGAATWKASEKFRVTLRLYRVEEAVSGHETETPVDMADASMILAQDVAPGSVASVTLQLPLMSPDGKPLPVWHQRDDWTYLVRWEVADGKGNGVSIDAMPICVVSYDFGPHFLSTQIPGELPAAHRLPVPISLMNDGPQIWKKNLVRVGYHWYYLDGTEYVFNDETTPIPQDIAPGQKLNGFLAWVTAPPCDGLYYLVWDLQVGDTWASTTSCTRVDDRLVQLVRVVDGKLQFVDLSTFYNIKGVTNEMMPGIGSFDDQGLSFPRALIPNYAISGPIPSNIWMPVDHGGPDSNRRIAFVWGSPNEKGEDFLACMGQRLELGKQSGVYRFVHILGASGSKALPTQLRLVFAIPGGGDAADLWALTVDPWNTLEANLQKVGFYCRWHNGPNGPQSGAVGLYHYVVPVTETSKLIAIQLPNAPDFRIAAITLEK